MKFKTPLSERIKRKQYLDSLKARGICVFCFGPNTQETWRKRLGFEPSKRCITRGKSTTWRCDDCNWRVYVRRRIRCCEEQIARCQKELSVRRKELRDMERRKTA